MEERLQKILSRAGVASRRAAERLIEEGRVSVNGETVHELGTRADVATDDIRVDGSRVRVADVLVYLVLNKPKGVVSTRRDPGGRPTVMDLVPKVAGLFPVGRLDVTTEGLLFLTTDGEFALRVSHPRYEVPRVYMAKVSGIPDERALEKLRAGVYWEGDRLVADRVKIVEADNNAWLEVTVHEGRNREVRRLLEAVGHPVSKLRRVAIGPVTDRGLEPGQFRELLPREVKVLLGSGPKDARDRKASCVRHPGGKGRLARPRPSRAMDAVDTERKDRRPRRDDDRPVRSAGHGQGGGFGKRGDYGPGRDSVAERPSGGRGGRDGSSSAGGFRRGDDGGSDARRRGRAPGRVSSTSSGGRGTETGFAGRGGTKGSRRPGPRTRGR